MTGPLHVFFLISTSSISTASLKFSQNFFLENRCYDQFILRFGDNLKTLNRQNVTGGVRGLRFCGFRLLFVRFCGFCRFFRAVFADFFVRLLPIFRAVFVRFCGFNSSLRYVTYFSGDPLFEKHLNVCTSHPAV